MHTTMKDLIELIKLSFLVENEDFLFFLLSNQKELYEQLIAADPDEDDNIINKAMEEYQKWSNLNKEPKEEEELRKRMRVWKGRLKEVGLWQSTCTRRYA